MPSATTIHTKVLTTSEAAYYPLPSFFEHAYHCWCSFISDMEDTFRQLSGVDKDKRKHCRNQGSDKWQKSASGRDEEAGQGKCDRQAL